MAIRKKIIKLVLLSCLILPISGCGGARAPVWTAVNLGAASSLWGVWGTSASNVYVLAQSWKIYHFNGSSWTEWY
ncbi:MAG: hypothetical protein ACM3WV_02805 [Bacillota bacterium]